MRTPSKAGVLGGSKLRKLCENPRITLPPHRSLQLPMHLKARELDGMRSKRSPLGPVTWQGEAPKKQLLYWPGLWEGPRGELRQPIALIPPPNDKERVEHFYTNPQSSLMEIKGNPILRHPKLIETPAKFRNKNNTMRTIGTLTLSDMKSRKPSMSWPIRDSTTASCEEEDVRITIIVTKKERKTMIRTAAQRL
ncbi:hypothetical protein Cgig2_015661 [Carnegiea gigantea]|uniref:Uncharacterized protein n=1 Tax=Carnegiea gigantea TaxID=171969 RepID=A0A9Q1JJS0_9CARY|nr:hypothetical protein Cgig2_015661 [Carnegiea gigantea]